MSWSQEQWWAHRAHLDQIREALAEAGMEPTGFTNGVPFFAKEVDWERVTAIAEAALKKPKPKPQRAPARKKSKPRRKKPKTER